MALKKILPVTVALLLGFARNAPGVDLWEQLKKALPEPISKRLPAPNASGLGDLLPFSQAEEVAIGRQVAGNLLGAAPLVNDLKLQQYINRVGGWVASRSERARLVWHFAVIDSEDLNAFAVPGGYVFVTKGLYRLLQSESELAGVLGHEIAHVNKKHHLHLLVQARLIEQGSEILKETAGESAAIKRLIGAGAEVLARALDKSAEFEADRMAVVLAARAGYDPFGLPLVLQELGRVPRQESRVALLFKTHPLPDDRLVRLDVAMSDRLDRFQGAVLAERFYRVRP